MSLVAGDGERENFHRPARALPATRRHAGTSPACYDTAGHSLNSRLCRVPAPAREGIASLGAARSPGKESTFRCAFALVSADVLDRVLGAWLHTRVVQAGGPLVIAVDGRTVRSAERKKREGPGPGRGLAHGTGARSAHTRNRTRSVQCASY